MALTQLPTLSIRAREFTRTRLGTIELSNGQDGWDLLLTGPVQDVQDACGTSLRWCKIGLPCDLGLQRCYRSIGEW